MRGRFQYLATVVGFHRGRFVHGIESSTGGSHLRVVGFRRLLGVIARFVSRITLKDDQLQRDALAVL